MRVYPYLAVSCSSHPEVIVFFLISLAFSYMVPFELDYCLRLWLTCNISYSLLLNVETKASGFSVHNFGNVNDDKF